MVVTSKKEDFLTSHVQNFECISIQNPVRGGKTAASEISFLESMSSSGGGSEGVRRK